MAMNLIQPPIGTSAQDWARIINDNFAKINYHNHTIENGDQIPTPFLSHNDIFFNGKSINNIEYLRFYNNDFGNSDACLFVNQNNDLCFKNATFVTQITSGAGLNAVGTAEGFTVVTDPPEAIFTTDPFEVKFLSSTSVFSSKVKANDITCNNIIAAGDYKTTEINKNSIITSQSADGGKYIVANVANPIVSFEAANTSWKTWETASLYKLSENGVLYYDNLVYAPPVDYNLTYFYGAKNVILGTDVEKKDKSGIRYSLKTLTFDITSNPYLQSRKFTIVENLKDHELVSICPLFETSTNLALNDSAMQTLSIPTIEFQPVDNADGTQSYYAIVTMDWRGKNFFYIRLIFKVILANEYSVSN